MTDLLSLSLSLSESGMNYDAMRVAVWLCSFALCTVGRGVM